MKLVSVAAVAALALALNILQVAGADTDGLSLCDTDGCECGEGGVVHCYCHHHQLLKLGLHGRVREASQPPADTRALHVENCRHVELFGGLLNHMQHLQNLTVRHSHAVVIHPKLLEPRGAPEEASTVHSIQLSNIHKLQVRRYSFKDLKVTGLFYLGEVAMDSVVSMAFHFKFVKEFSIFASSFERISMFGVKISDCKEFNVLGMTQFTTLAAHAIKVKCDKFSLAYNWFGHLHDSSFDVEFGLCDIQGNTFHSLQGKPFLSLAPQFSLNNEISQMGLVFRENKFDSFPVLPFASLALPSFGNLPATSSYIDIDSNQFVCDCQSIGWLLAFGKLGYNAASLASVGKVAPRDDVSFTREVFGSAGRCLQCRGEECVETADTVAEFAAAAVRADGAGVSCDGVPVKNHDLELNNQMRDSAKSLGWGDVAVKNEKLVRKHESGERLINDSCICRSNSKLIYVLLMGILITYLQNNMLSRPQ